MPASRTVKRIAACLISTVLSACNLGSGSNSLFSSSSSSSGGSSSGGNADPEGIWTGTDNSVNPPLVLVGIVEASGVFDFIRSDNAQFIGTADISGTSISADYEGITQFKGSTFPNGAGYGTGSFSGTLAAASSITASSSFTPLNDATTYTGAWSLNFDQIYNSGSSFAMISGNYTNQSVGPSTGAIVSVSGTGELTAQDATSSCVLNGQISLLNSTFDAYSVTYTYSNCGTGYTQLNNVAFAGLGVLNSSNSPAQLIIGVTGISSGTTYGDVLQLTLN